MLSRPKSPKVGLASLWGLTDENRSNWVGNCRNRQNWICSFWKRIVLLRNHYKSAPIKYCKSKNYNEKSLFNSVGVKKIFKDFLQGYLLLRKAFYCNKFINWSFNFRFDINFKELIQIFANSVFNSIEPWPPKSPRIQISFNSKSPFLLKKSFHFFFKNHRWVWWAEVSRGNPRTWTFRTNGC